MMKEPTKKPVYNRTRTKFVVEGVNIRAVQSTTTNRARPHKNK